MCLFRDWRYALYIPRVYQIIGNRTAIRISHRDSLIFVAAIIITILILFFTRSPLTENDCIVLSTEYESMHECFGHRYNKTYPISTPINSAMGITYRFGIVSDLDLKSKNRNQTNTWISIFRKGRLLWSPLSNHISITWDPNDIVLSSTLSMKNRAMELSELITFDGVLTSFDDRTGVVYRIDHDKIYPWIILMDGNGKNEKGFKSEWATIKNGQLYVGSMGKEWTTPSGEFIHSNPMWIKIISPCGQIISVDWSGNFEKLRRTMNIEFPGYMIHESGAWSSIHNRWFFLPRRCSHSQYDEIQDERMGCDVLLIADTEFDTVEIVHIENSIPIRGFSSFKFLPGSKDTIIVALKTEEYHGETATYITAFTIHGKILLSDIKIAHEKFEGLEFI